MASRATISGTVGTGLTRTKEFVSDRAPEAILGPMYHSAMLLRSSKINYREEDFVLMVE
jgi:hypothetical protein